MREKTHKLRRNCKNPAVAKRGLRGERQQRWQHEGKTRREEKQCEHWTVLTRTAHCGPRPSPAPSPSPRAEGHSLGKSQPCYAVSTVPAQLPSWTGYQRVQLVLQLLVGPLGSCVAVLQPVEEYKADPWARIPVPSSDPAQPFPDMGELRFLIRIR